MASNQVAGVDVELLHPAQNRSHLGDDLSTHGSTVKNTAVHEPT